ncbi:MAG: peptidylprolyl isomerase [gamma proteobacterium symbiont of Lucinoma myriamae]|nr:peptidylprolyl isomerase [gamma proteobacterium symbiont of Lucinoma myriamae]MCU7819165.1 peptidylprolyl isomerase [gamma proteobacterium symbiont of Lucinoma myriamae]MCU7832064.1 peptidylprolyl isomerase [gamma proteobacterium symbiont of Lucinoma myriamae]
MNLKTSLHFLTQSTIRPKKLALALTCSALFLAASPLMAEDKVLAIVNGHDITQSQLEIAATQSKINVKEITTEQKKLLTEALINRQLVLNEAIKANYDKDPDIAARVKALTDSYIAVNYLATVAEKLQSSEDEIKAYYDKNIIGHTPQEYKARHILVKTEDEAKTLIKEIEGGADFAKLAKEKSTDAGSAANGGDLGWFTEQSMVAPFAKAVAGLKKGELAKAPVNSEFGWHVIILDDKRSAPPPEFSAVKANIDKVLIKEKLNQYLSELNANAKVQLK